MRLSLMLAIMALLSIAPANALIINNNGLFTTGNEQVSVKFVSYEAAHTDLLFQSSPTLQYLFTNKTATPGDTVDLGIFGDATELIFRLDDVTTNNSYFSGDPTRNADNTLHALFTSLGDNAYRMGFEDLWNGGDFDYNDLIVEIRGVPFEDRDEPVVPEPATLGLIGVGLAMAGTLRRRRQPSLS